MATQKATNTKTAKEKMIEKIVNMGAGYSENDCKAMKTNELKELLIELQNEKKQPLPEVAEDGSLVVPEPIAPIEPIAPPRTKGERSGTSKRDVLYAVFDKAQEEGVDLKAAAKAALPETSDGVVSSYLCYWRKDRGVVATRGFGNKGGTSKAVKVAALIAKLYGDEDLEVVFAEVKAAFTAA